MTKLAGVQIVRKVRVADRAVTLHWAQAQAVVPTNNSVLVGGQGLASFPLRPAPD